MDVNAVNAVCAVCLEKGGSKMWCCSAHLHASCLRRCIVSGYADCPACRRPYVDARTVCYLTVAANFFYHIIKIVEYAGLIVFRASALIVTGILLVVFTADIMLYYCVCLVRQPVVCAMRIASIIFVIKQFGMGISATGYSRAESS